MVWLGFFNSALEESRDCLQDHSVALFRGPQSSSDSFPLAPDQLGFQDCAAEGAEPQLEEPGAEELCPDTAHPSLCSSATQIQPHLVALSPKERGGKADFSCCSIPAWCEEQDTAGSHSSLSAIQGGLVCV